MRPVVEVPSQEAVLKIGPIPKDGGVVSRRDKLLNCSWRVRGSRSLLFADCLVLEQHHAPADFLILPVGVGDDLRRSLGQRLFPRRGTFHPTGKAPGVLWLS